MTSQKLIFEAEQNGLGSFECTSYTEATETQASENNVQKDTSSTDQAEVSAHSKEQAYYIDPNILNSPPQYWVEQANQVFHQGLQANMQGGHNDYFLKVQAQFDHMYAQLHAQMTNYNFGK
jgi:hypothetical protein